jgi:hypothetical protein
MKKPILSLLLIITSHILFAQTFFGVTSAPAADPGAQAGPTVSVPHPNLMLTGDLVVLYVQYRLQSAAITMPANGGQTWTNAVNNYSPGAFNQTVSIYWCRYNGTWAGNPSVSIGAGTNSLTAVMYVFRPSNSNSLVNVSGKYNFR